MSEEVIVDGQTYISSRRAAELCGYAQDYVGQLARSGRVEARRVAGLWYVQESAIREHQTKAETHVPAPRKDVESRVADTVLGDDGIEYVSANRASRLSGYNQDYIGQLARSEQIPARQFGNRWYVIVDALLAHKREKDALLAAVQTESVGLSKILESSEESEPQQLTHYEYRPEEAPLLPVIPHSSSVDSTPAKHEPDSETTAYSGVASDTSRHVPIRVFRGAPTRAPRGVSRDITRNKLAMPALSTIGIIVIATGIFVVISSGGSPLPASVAQNGASGDSTTSNLSAQSASAVETSDLRAFLRENVWSTHLEYSRAETR